MSEPLEKLEDTLIWSALPGDSCPRLFDEPHPEPATDPLYGSEIPVAVSGIEEDRTSVAVPLGPPVASTTRPRLANKAVRPGLGAKSPDAAGDLTWTWKIGSATGAGTGSVRVTCGEDSLSKSFSIIE